jgi:hypothetical protein
MCIRYSKLAKASVKVSHSICLLDPDDFVEFYIRINKYLSDGFVVLYDIESSPNQTFARMNQSGAIEDLEDHIESGVLRIVDRESIYSASATGPDSKLMLNTWRSIISDTQRRGRFKGTLILAGGTTIFTDMNRTADLVIYEQGVNDVLATFRKKSLQVICCYQSASIEKIPISHLISIINAHQYSIGREWSFNRCSSSDISGLIRKGLSYALDEETAKLVFKTMKLIYKVDEEEIVRNPGLFEETLIKIIGKSAAYNALKAISREAKEWLKR